MTNRWMFLLRGLRERLWVRPFILCVLSVMGVMLAHLANGSALVEYVPDISRDSIESLLKIIAASMLVIATFAVASMVSAYASASSSATPRALALVIADSTSQNALSSFIGGFIFSVVGLIATMNGFYDEAGRFVMFVFTVLTFVVVIVMFVRWVDSIARLGRLGNTIDRVETATRDAITRRQKDPWLGGRGDEQDIASGIPVAGADIGYVAHIDMLALQDAAEQSDVRIVVACLPGAYTTPDRPVAHVLPGTIKDGNDALMEAIARAFTIRSERAFAQDPRFGIVVLSEIASRALSPAVNDPGTAIDVTGRLVRLLVHWTRSGREAADRSPRFDRVFVPLLSLSDLLDDAFTGIARDGAACVEVAVRLMRALETLTSLGDDAIRAEAVSQAKLALTRSEAAMSIAHDLARVRHSARFATHSVADV